MTVNLQAITDSDSQRILIEFLGVVDAIFMPVERPVAYVCEMRASYRASGLRLPMSWEKIVRRMARAGIFKLVRDRLKFTLDGQNVARAVAGAPGLKASWHACRVLWGYAFKGVDVVKPDQFKADEATLIGAMLPALVAHFVEFNGIGYLLTDAGLEFAKGDAPELVEVETLFAWNGRYLQERQLSGETLHAVWSDQALQKIDDNEEQ